MKLKINDNMILIGTPEEMAEFIYLTRMPEDGGPFNPIEKKVITPEVPEKPKAKRVDWPKAEALKAAGWTNKAIAEELGCNPVTVGVHFREKELTEAEA